MNNAWQALAVLLGEALARRWWVRADERRGQTKNAVAGHKPDALATQSAKEDSSQEGEQ